MSQVCVRDRRNRDEPIETSCLDYNWVEERTMARLRQKAEEKEQKDVVIKPLTAPAAAAVATTTTTATTATTTTTTAKATSPKR